MKIYILLLAFSGVGFYYIPAGAAVQRLLLFLLLTILLLMRRYSKFSIDSMRLIAPFVIYTFYCALSAYYVSGSISYVASSVFTLCMSIIYYIYIVGGKFSISDISKIKKYLLIILFFQMIFIFIKLVVHGIDEKFLIGTMSNTAGQLGFLFPAIAIPIVCYFTATKNRKIMWILIFLLISFGIISEKRSIIFILPLIIFASLKINSEIGDNNLILSQKIIIAIFSLATIFFGAYFIPSLNIDDSYGGSVSFIYIFEYALEYLVMDYGGPLQGSYDDALSDTGVQVGRISLLIYIFEWLKQQKISLILFGVGYGAITPSEWLTNQSDLLFNLIGARGAISGFALNIIETGVIGSTLMMAFFLFLFSRVLILSRKEKKVRVIRWYKTVLIILIIFMYDYFFYSTLLLRTLPMPIVLFSIVASIEIVKKYSKPREALQKSS